MWDIEVIRSMNRDAAKKSRRQKAVPYHLTSPSEVVDMASFPFPYLGDACDDFDHTLRRLEPDLFVDSSGFGQPGEPALCLAEFKQELLRLLQVHGELHLAVSEAGQFQVYVALWVRR